MSLFLFSYSQIFYIRKALVSCFLSFVKPGPWPILPILYICQSSYSVERHLCYCFRWPNYKTGWLTPTSQLYSKGWANCTSSCICLFKHFLKYSVFNKSVTPPPPDDQKLPKANTPLHLVSSRVQSSVSKAHMLKNGWLVDCFPYLKFCHLLNYCQAYPMKLPFFLDRQGTQRSVDEYFLKG